MRTTFTGEFEGVPDICTEFAQKKTRKPREPVTFPVTVEFKHLRAKIYRPAKGFPFYRVAFTVDGKRKMLTFGTYGEANEAAEAKLRELHKGHKGAALTSAQSRDALVAFEQLQAYRQSTGRRISLLTAVSKFIESDRKLDGRSHDEAIDGYLRTVASIKRMDIQEAVKEFLQADAPRTKAAEGQRAQLSEKYAYIRELQLNRFAGTFPNNAVCDLTKEHLDTFIGSLDKVKKTSKNGRAANSAKSRNHYRATVRQFLLWSVRKDYLSPTHRLFEADAMRPERANTAAVDFYTPDEFAALLAAAKGDLKPLRPIIAIGGFAGLRTAELLRLDWADVWRVEGHIEITAGKAKTRQRRLVEVCPALAAWLEPFRKNTSGKLWTGHEITFQQHFVDLCEKAVMKRKGKDVAVSRKTNGLRHAFCTYHFAAHANENQTAQQAGNTPAMIHGHYKGLATKAEAEKWFNVNPPAKTNPPPGCETKAKI
jgi:integrase